MVVGKKKSAFAALVPLIGVGKYKSHVFNPAATSYIPLVEELSATRQEGGTAPGWGICASGCSISSDENGLLRVKLNWNKGGLWEQDLYICVDPRKGTSKEWDALMCSLGCEIQEWLEWELVGEINCAEPASSVMMSCSVVKHSEMCPPKSSF